MKPFDANKALCGDEICTREGRKAKLLCVNLLNVQPVAARSLLISQGRRTRHITASGQRYVDMVIGF